MNPPAQQRVAVVGGGAFGLCCAVALARSGQLVTLYDARPRQSASAVAAGMLAPWSEWLLDAAAADLFDLLSHAHALWPDFAVATDVDLDTTGALHLAPQSELNARLGRLHDRGVAARLCDPAGLQVEVARDCALHLPSERRLDPSAALAALEHAFLAAGGRRVEEDVVLGADGRLQGEGRTLLRTDLVVLAAGAGGAGFVAAFPELAVLTPIKGQLLRLRAPPFAGPTVRGEGVYLAPQPGGVLVGATMVEGAFDLVPDPSASVALRAAAVHIRPHLASATGEDAVGVRMAAPDGRPLVGWSSRPGVLIATGARRNGWLFAPLVAEMVAAYAAGRDPGPFAAALSPTASQTF